MAAIPLLAAFLQLVLGDTHNFVYDLIFLAIVLIAHSVNQRPWPLGSLLFLLVLPPFLVWFEPPSGVDSLFISGFTAYSVLLVLPTVLAAVSLGIQGVLLFTLYGLMVGGLSFEVMPREGITIALSTVTGLVAGTMLAWLLTFTEEALKQTEEALKQAKHSALADALTNLGNRRAFEAALLQAWQAGPEHVGLAFLDLDGLKGVNDQHGHEMGDALLQALAQAVQAQLQVGQAVFRLAGDEFVVLCTHCELSQVWHQIREAVVQVRQQGFPEMDVSVGLASGTTAGSIPSLMQQADSRMYAEKRRKADRRVQVDPRGTVLSWNGAERRKIR
ncbi:GGDEF domain-containing protein [Deinococcus sp. QL22]|uniref:GGDEF domain-containing protein n=1 Tax=Deinococcus sp. QL22 TaxID=2939437 RepID=UPI00201761DE|nr:GGDEF domain-containing protein [Deinococcus sp. QL22]UQN08760.1 GGDEF domain-containing protein [Deinococcus sp. QL22]